jgi:hypothetical protein
VVHEVRTIEHRGALDPGLSQTLPEPHAREIHQHRGHDPRVDEHWVDATEPSCPRTFVDDGLEGLTTSVSPNDRRVEMGAASATSRNQIGAKAVGPLLCSDGLDEEADLRFRRTAESAALVPRPTA